MPEGGYVFSDELCSGPTTVVRRCTDAQNRACIAKAFPKSHASKRLFQKETLFLRQFGSRYVPTLFDSFETPRNCVIVMEDCGKTLFDVVTENSEISAGTVRSIAAQMLKAVAHLHASNVLHGDIKLENVAIDGDGAVKLLDFGLAEHMRANLGSRQGCGSTNYRAPEVLVRRPHTLKADVWALGVTLCALAVGHFPFASSSEYMHATEVLSRPPRLDDLRRKRGDALAELVALMLTVNDAKRPTVHECLGHRYFRPE